MKMLLVSALAALAAFGSEVEARDALVGRMELYRNREPVTTLEKMPLDVAKPILMATGVDPLVADAISTKLLSVLDSTSRGWKPRYELPNGYTICTARLSSADLGSGSVDIESHAAIITARIYRNYRQGTAEARDGVYFSADVPRNGRVHVMMDVVFVHLEDVNRYRCAPDGPTLLFESIYNKTTVFWP